MFCTFLIISSDWSKPHIQATTFIGSSQFVRTILPLTHSAGTIVRFTNIHSNLSVKGGRYWDRTSDPFHVKEVRYRCANRPKGTNTTLVI